MATFLSQILIFMSSVFLARTLGTIEFGKFILIQSTLANLGLFAGAGIGAASTRSISAYIETDKGRVRRILGLNSLCILITSLTLALATYFCAGYLSHELFGDGNLEMVFILVSPSIFFVALDSYNRSVLLGLGQVKVYAKITILGLLAYLPVITLLSYKYGVNGAAAGLTISSLFQIVVSYFGCRIALAESFLKADYKSCYKEIKILKTFALPAFISGAMVIPVHWFIQILVTKSDSGFYGVAILGICMQWFNIFQLIPTILGRVIMPKSTSQFISGDFQGYYSTIYTAFAINIITLLPITLILFISSNLVLSIYGDEYSGESITLGLALLAGAIKGIVSPIGSSLMAQDKMWLATLMNLFWAASYLVFSYFLISHGVLGVMLSILLAYLMHALWSYMWFSKQRYA